MSVWREVLGPRPDAARRVVRIGRVALHVAPALSSPADVAALAAWRGALLSAGEEPPAAWSLGAGGEGRLLLLYARDASPADLIEGFAVAWLAARDAAGALLLEVGWGGRSVWVGGVSGIIACEPV